MKTWKGVTLEAIAASANLVLAKCEALKYKKNKKPLAAISDTVGIKAVRDSILDGSYRSSRPWTFRRKDRITGKERLLQSPAPIDQIVQHAIVQVLEPYMTGYLHPHQVASIPGRGIEYGRKLLHRFAISKRRDSKYVMKADLRHYYASISLSVLRCKLARHIRDSRAVDLIFLSLGSESGLPLGSYLSQWLANYMLADYLHAASRACKVGNILVNMDNITMTFASKRKAKAALRWSISYLASEGLEIKTRGPESAQVFKWQDGCIDAVAYKSYKDGSQKIRGHIYLSVRRMMSRIAKAGSASFSQSKSLLSRVGFIKHSSSKNLYDSCFNFISKYQLKKIVGYYSRRRAMTCIA